MPAGSAKSAEHALRRRRLVEMHRLRIELGGEGDDFLARHQARAVNGDRAGLEIFPVDALFHLASRDGCALYGRTARMRSQTSARTQLPVNGSGRKPEMHHVAVGDHVFLAFEPHLAGFLGAGLAAVGDVVVIGDGLGRG